MMTQPITVLNADGRDKEQHFPDFEGKPDAAVHPPVNFHAYAACTGGSFQRDVRMAVNLGRPVLILIRGDLKAALKALTVVKKAALPAAVSMKETGFHQVAGQLDSPRKIGLLQEILNRCDGVISPTEELLPFYCALAPRLRDRMAFIPTPYPLESGHWNFSQPIETRSGLFVGTREFSTPTRNHLQALTIACALAREAGCRLSLINKDSRLTAEYPALFDLPGRTVNILPRMKYPDYLKTVAGHRLVFQMDMSQVPGQVAGDSALCRVPCIGGNGAIDQLIYPEYVGIKRMDLRTQAHRLLTDDAFYRDSIASAELRACEKFSFKTGRASLAEFFQRITTKIG